MVNPRDRENVMLPDRIQKINFESILINELTYLVRFCPFVIQLL